MGLLDALLGRGRSAPVRKRRRRCVRYEHVREGGFLGVGGKTRRRCTKYSDSPAVEERKQQREQLAIDRKAETWLRRDTARREREQAKREQQEQRQRTRAQTRLMRQAGRTERAHEREVTQLKHQGWTDAEIRQLLEERENPRRFNLAMELLRGGVHHNPGCAPCAFAATNPSSAAEWSSKFHGSPEFTQGGKLVLGTVERINYRAPEGSKRAGHWTHAAGETGMPFVHNRGRAKLLADPNTGKLELDTRGSGVHVSPKRGIIG